MFKRTCIDVFVKHSNTNKVYVSIHKHFVEIYIEYNPSRHLKNTPEDFFKGLFTHKKWNRKYPKLLKILQREGAISDCNWEKRFMGISEYEEMIYQYLRSNFSVCMVEQNRENKEWGYDELMFPIEYQRKQNQFYFQRWKKQVLQTL